MIPVATYDYDGEYLTWSKDGLAGYIMLHNRKFALTGHSGIPIKEDGSFDLDKQKNYLHR